MNCDLIGLLESNHFKNNKKMNGIIHLNGRPLCANEARKIVRAAVRAGYTDLYSVPDEWAESILKGEQKQ